MELTASRKDAVADLSLMVGGDSIVKIEAMSDTLFDKPGASIDKPDAIVTRLLAKQTI